MRLEEPTVVSFANMCDTEDVNYVGNNDFQSPCPEWISHFFVGILYRVGDAVKVTYCCVMCKQFCLASTLLMRIRLVSCADLRGAGL